jgi:RNA polymerase sigma-70 factor (ECF subfamily)
MTRDAADFDAFYEARLPGLTYALYLACGDWTRAEDCAQEAFVRAWQRWGPLSNDDPTAWVRTVAWRLCIDQWRSSIRVRRSLHRLRSDTEPIVPGPEPDALSERLSPLSPALKAVAVLYYLDDLAVVEIADLLALPEGTVKSRLARAREVLRAHHAANEGVET